MTLAGSPRVNDGFEYRETCGPETRGTTLLAYLSARYTHSSAASWRARIDSGEVRVDGQKAIPDAVLGSGMVLSWNRPPWQEPEAPLDFECVHLDGHLLVVSKPAGLPTLPGAGFFQHTLLWQVQQEHPEATPMHRLGRFTSGLVLFALTAAARSAVAQAWREGRVRKLYRALAAGVPPSDAFTVEDPIGRVPYPPLGTLHAASPCGKPAETRVRVLERREGRFVAEIDLVTGRPHQIRIHLASAGHPLVGDPLYGPGGRPVAGSRALPGDPGYHLHATRLTLPPPFAVDVACDPPPVLRHQKTGTDLFDSASNQANK